MLRLRQRVPYEHVDTNSITATITNNTINADIMKHCTVGKQTDKRRSKQAKREGDIDDQSKHNTDKCVFRLP